jgi:hypothetical protein
MKWWKLHKNLEIEQQKEEIAGLLREIEEAKRQWITAQNRLDFAVDHDEIEYAIYALEAAEIKYGILLRQAKQLNVSWPEYMAGSKLKPKRRQPAEAHVPGIHAGRQEKTEAGE